MPTYIYMQQSYIRQGTRIMLAERTKEEATTNTLVVYVCIIYIYICTLYAHDAHALTQETGQIRNEYTHRQMRLHYLRNWES